MNKNELLLSYTDHKSIKTKYCNYNVNFLQICKLKSLMIATIGNMMIKNYLLLENGKFKLKSIN